MDKLKFEIPTLQRKEDAIEYINEFFKYDSKINGAGGLNKYLDSYEDWIVKLDQDYKTIASEKRVPAKTFFLVRESDNKIVGMINIRLALNERLKKRGGHIGYSIRPTERKKGYNKVNLYLGLLECQKNEIREVLMSCYKDNPASYKTMSALGAQLKSEFFSEEDNCIVQNYTINVNKSINEYKDVYGKRIVLK